VTIRLQGNDIICTGIGKVQHDTLTSTDNFQKFVLAAHPQNAWCTENVEIANVKALTKAIQTGKIRAVSDGSYKDSYTIAAVIIEDHQDLLHEVSRDSSRRISSNVSIQRGINQNILNHVSSHSALPIQECKVGRDPLWVRRTIGSPMCR
jgi:hypothetical protein